MVIINEIMNLLPSIFKPKFEYDIIRLGTNYDGGYLVSRASIFKSDCLYSFGISTNWDFEKDFINLHNIKLFAYDGSISPKSWDELIIKKLKRGSFSKALKLIYQKNKFFKFFNKNNFFSINIGNINPDSISLKKILSNNKKDKLFFKIDIEGSEYEILEEIIYFQEQIVGLCIEFHSCNKNLPKIIKFIENFNLEIVHLHANNYKLPLPDEIPDVLELTFARNPNIQGEFKQLPNKLDMPNKSKEKEIILNFEC